MKYQIGDFVIINKPLGHKECGIIIKCKNYKNNNIYEILVSGNKEFYNEFWLEK